MLGFAGETEAVPRQAGASVSSVLSLGVFSLMKRAFWFTAAAAAMLCGIAAADEQIYESTEKGGVPEFSGQPAPGSESVTLPAPNVIDTSQQPAQPPPQAAFPGYSQLAILFPAEQGTMHTNTGAFNVKVAVQPALNAGDAFMVTLDGKALAGRYTSADIPITSEDFQMAAADNVEHKVQVAVVDASGNVLIAASPVSFYVHRATVHRDRER
jgi:hypothetical protein